MDILKRPKLQSFKDEKGSDHEMFKAKCTEFMNWRPFLEVKTSLPKPFANFEKLSSLNKITGYIDMYNIKFIRNMLNENISNYVK